MVEAAAFLDSSGSAEIAPGLTEIRRSAAAKEKIVFM
jgi:hypothetical protein